MQYKLTQQYKANIHRQKLKKKKEAPGKFLQHYLLDSTLEFLI